MDEKMHFTRMDQGTDEDFRILKRVHEVTLRDLPDRLLRMLADLSGDQAYNLNRRDHSLQAATRALRDGASEEMVVVALFHDIGEALGPMNHGEIAASILHPFISEDSYNLLKYHGVFQTYFFGAHLGLDANARDRYRAEPWYDSAVNFCASYDEVSFDPAYPNEPMATFELIVRRFLDRPWQPPAAATR
ncbi:MAG TPA: phosphohydrolase [Candidatus Bathyarchaeia archaeon]|nr:phosphohydrolase [Candidatus Bathyarchaeia archaeon]